ncbi:MAG TPA: hypothetical protein VM901_11870 [Bdellovibrionota bacterium]|jgi:hypothetical protein|nr:hypothetical protein [Bdellovibrionota bacterium]
MKTGFLVAFSLLASMEAWSQSQTVIHKAVPVDEAPLRARAVTQSKHYIIVKPEWDESDEQEFSNFVAALGASGCSTLENCLKGKANPFRNTDPDDLSFFTDCADFPYMLRAYFAWKRGLPFSVASRVGTADKPEEGKDFDIRYTQSGNFIAARRDFTTPIVYNKEGRVNGGNHFTLDEMWNHAQNILSSAMYRTDPRKPDPKFFSDFYSPAITRDQIRPGTVVYAPHGHVGIVHRVDENGNVYILQSGIEGDISRIRLNNTSYPQSRTEHGAGFKNWRPLKLVGATTFQPPGVQMNVYLGGHVEGMSDDQLRDQGKLSLEQYGRVNGKFDLRGQKLGWEDYVTAKLSTKAWRRDPVGDLGKRLEALCAQVKARISSVNHALDRGLPQLAHPERLPSNIFGSGGDPEWQTFSTPGRDANMREMMHDTIVFTNEMLSMSSDQIEETTYRGKNLKADMGAELKRQSQACTLSYRNSRGTNVPLSLVDVMKRADRMSFDPYHCPELRWGATGTELAGCAQGTDSQAWYEAQAPLRTSRFRDTKQSHGYTLSEAQTELRRYRDGKGKFDLTQVL